jgi:uncharacterized membrane protein YjgN (DUF898 family)
MQRLSTRFHGDGLALALILLKNVFLTLVTFGIYSFWGKVRTRKFLWQNVEVDGQRLMYHGTGKELLIGGLKVLGFYLVTTVLSVAAARVGKDAQQAFQALFGSIMLVLLPYAIFSARRYLFSRTSWRGLRFGVEKDGKRYAGTAACGAILSLITFGLYAPVLADRLYAIRTNASYSGSAKFRYSGDWRGTYGAYVFGFILTVLTLGLYAPFMMARIRRYRAAHTHVGNELAGEMTMAYDATGAQTFGLMAGNLLLLLVTAGLAAPWVIARSARFGVERTSFGGSLDLARNTRAASAGDAAADGMVDALDADVGLAF